MTTPNEELISMLRAKGCPDWVTARWLMESAADLLQSQAERIATLEGDVEYLQEDIDAMCNAIPNYHWSGGAAELIAKCFAERDTLRAELVDAELHTKQEPLTDEQRNALDATTYTAKGATMTFLELRAAIINLLNKADNLSAEEVYGVVASVEAEVRLSMFATMKQVQQEDTL